MFSFKAPPSEWEWFTESVMGGVKLRLMFVLDCCYKIPLHENRRVHSCTIFGHFVWTPRCWQSENDEFREKSFGANLSILHLSHKIWDEELVCCASHFEGIQIFCRVKNIELSPFSSKFSSRMLPHEAKGNFVDPDVSCWRCKHIWRFSKLTASSFTIPLYQMDKAMLWWRRIIKVQKGRNPCT